ncbi:Uncharacterized protein RNJ44_02274 [Nakaseomyces bracarensis]|uniref:Obg-like ATPase 1 n=1 Tax=Nakaseomyces bracarensis TaxID=273131 RepID=A0ABR4NMY9_9SACH
MKVLGSLKVTNNPTSGIVGLANVGKSTFFQTITNSHLGTAANYPFATIDPEVSKVPIPAPELPVLQRLYQSEKCVPAALTIYDIAGLTRGASQGQGLGNKFLNDIRHVDGIFNLVRGFKDDNITHIEGNVDPVRDLSVVQDELILKDLEFIETIREKSSRRIRMVPKNTKAHKELSFEIELLNQLEEHLYDGKKIRHFKSNNEDWTVDDIKVLRRNNFLTAKPSLTLLNISPEEFINFNQSRDIDSINQVKEIKDWLKEYSPNDDLMLFSAEFEKNYLEHMKNNDRSGLIKYCEKFTTTTVTDSILESSLPGIILRMKTLLGLISYFTCGPLEVRQWNVRKGSTAPEAAGVIHSDLEETFISADIIKYDSIKDMIPPISESNLKKASLIKRAGKGYIMEESDIALFKASSGKTR